MIALLKLIYNLLLYCFLKPVDLVTSIILEVKSIVHEGIIATKTSRKEEISHGDY